MNIILALIGFALLIKCADIFVSGASSFAKNLKVPTIVIGLTIVAFGTSAPELAISFSSHLSGNADMMFGNVFGSSIANVLFILGLAVLVVPLEISGDVIKKQIPILLLITVGVSVLFLDSVFSGAETNGLSRADGIVMLLLFSVFVYYLISAVKDKKSDDDAKPKYKTITSIALIIGGLAGVIFGSNLVVNNVASFAENIGVSQKVISVTIIAIGTSLPELVTTIVATRKGESNLAIGNIIGSNIFNISIVLGLPVVAMGEVQTLAFGVVDIMFMLLAVVLLWVFSATGRKLKRYEGAILVIMYATYIFYVL